MTVPFAPFKILSLAPFAPQQKDACGRPVPVDPDRLDDAVAALSPRAAVDVPRDLVPEGRVEVEIRRLGDFDPDGLLAAVPRLAAVADALDFARSAPSRGISDEEVRNRLRAVPGLAPLVPPAPPASRDAGAAPRKTTLDDILRMVAIPETPRAPAGAMRETIGLIEAALGAAIRRILLDPAFRAAESAWRGLSILARQGAGGGDLAFELAPVTEEMLEETLVRLSLGCAEDPPSLVLVDLPFDNTPRGIDLLEKVCAFAESLLAPAACWVGPAAFGIDRWEDLPRLAYLPHALEAPQFAKMRRLRGLPSARWAAVACNRFLVRAAHEPRNGRSRVRFDEGEALCASPVWALGAVVAQSVRRHGFPTRFTEWPTVRLENLPLRAHGPGHAIPAETIFPEDRLLQFPKAGFTPLAAALDRDFVFFPVETAFGGGSFCQKLLLAQVVRILIRCKDNLPADLSGAQIEKEIARAFAAHWERAGHPAPASLSIAARAAPDGGTGAVRVTLDPSREVLPTGERIELEMPW